MYKQKIRIFFKEKITKQNKTSGTMPEVLQPSRYCYCVRSYERLWPLESRPNMDTHTPWGEVVDSNSTLVEVGAVEEAEEHSKGEG